MIIDIEKIVIKDDRIRKDFGDIQELADDIKENGLIQPPVVNKDYELLAGERRLRACESLGWKQIEVRMMDTRDAEHELNVEISENDMRKGFTKSERVDYMKRLLRIEQAKAKKRQDLGLKSDEGQRADEATAKKFDIGRDTMRKEMSIVENKNLLTPSDFADWDEGKLSTNKAYQLLKQQLAAKDEKIKELEKQKPDSRKDKFYEDRISQLSKENAELKEKSATTQKVSACPSDYKDLKSKVSSLEAENKKLHENNAELTNTIATKNEEIDSLLADSPENYYSVELGKLRKEYSSLKQEHDNLKNEAAFSGVDLDFYKKKAESLEQENQHLRNQVSDITNNWDPTYFDNNIMKGVDDNSCLREYCRNATILFNKVLMKSQDVRILRALANDENARNEYFEFLDFVSNWLEDQYARATKKVTVIDSIAQ